MARTKDVKNKLLEAKHSSLPKAEDYLSTSYTPLDLACTKRIKGAILKGTYVLLVGKSNSGKTIVGHAMLAEACASPNFANYRIICDNPERGAMPQLIKLFGSELENRIEPPAGTIEDPIHSTTVEEFYYHLDNAITAGKPFVYLLDSMDALDSDEENELFEEKKAYHEGTSKKKPKGSYKMGKPKVNSSWLKRAIVRLPKNGSILIIIAQTRDKVNTFAKGDKDTRAGGHALTFYAAVEMWFSIREKLKRNIKGKDRIIGTLSRVRVKRSRVSGKDQTVFMPIYNSFGIDDIGGCVDFLIEEKHWKTGKDGINAREFEFKGNREELVKLIEELDAETELRKLVKKVWLEIEAACAVKRKARYS